MTTDIVEPYKKFPAHEILVNDMILYLGLVSKWYGGEGMIYTWNSVFTLLKLGDGYIGIHLLSMLLKIFGIFYNKTFVFKSNSNTVDEKGTFPVETGSLYRGNSI